MLTREDMPKLRNMNDHDLLLTLTQSFVDFKDNHDKEHKGIAKHFGALWGAVVFVGGAVITAFIAHICA